MAEIQNANPTILNISDLPTRSPEFSRKAAGIDDGGLFGPLAQSTLLEDPFDHYTSSTGSESEEDATVDLLDEQEIFDLISTISDPEHPLSLGELAVVNLPHIRVRDDPSLPYSTVEVDVTPTINHCSLATVIGLGIRVRLEQSLPPRFRVDVRIREGTHATAEQVNKQLNDKERVAAAMENSTLMSVLTKMLETCK